MLVVLWSTDSDLNLTYLLGGGLQLTGEEVNNVLGNSLKDILMNDMASMPNHITPMEGHQRALNGVPADYETKHGDQSFDCHVEPLTSRDGTVIGTMGIARDISDLVKVREQFLFAQKMEAVGRLAGGVAHDINNLLTAVMGYVDILKRGLSEDDPLLRHVEAIGRASQRGDSMISKLMTYGRKQVSHPQNLDLGTQVAELEDFVGRLVSDNVVLSVDIESSSNIACVDPVQFEQVMLNLVVNASDAMPEGGELHISVHTKDVAVTEVGKYNLPKPGPYVFVRVSDEGAGIPEEIGQQIFEPFFTTKSVGQGTGLGLSTVYAIAQGSKGGVSYETSVGEGTVFSVGFPCVDGVGEQEPSMEGESPRELPQIAKNVLLVEDDEMVRTLVRDILSESGFTVMEAHFGPAALALSRQLNGKLDLLVADVVMPQQSGPKLAETIRAENPDASVLFISGHSDSGVTEDLEGGVGFLAKPFQPNVLLEKVQVLLEIDDET